MRSLVLILTALFVLAGCGGPRWQNIQVDEQSAYTVRVQHRVADDKVQTQGYRHPLVVDERILSDMLEQLTYRAKGVLVSSGGPVFHELEVRQLAPALVQALSTADQNQRIFFSSFFREPGSALRERRTDGVLFVDAQAQLNIAFANIRLLPDIDNMNPRSMDGILEPLQVTDSLVTLAMDAEHWHHQLQSNAKPYPLWVKVDASLLYESALGTESSDPSMGTVQQHRERVRTGLEFLQELHESGLISEQEYTERRSRLLDTLQ